MELLPEVSELHFFDFLAARCFVVANVSSSSVEALLEQSACVRVVLWHDGVRVNLKPSLVLVGGLRFGFRLLASCFFFCGMDLVACSVGCLCRSFFVCLGLVWPGRSLRGRTGGADPPSTSDCVTAISAMPSAMQW